MVTKRPKPVIINKKEIEATARKTASIATVFGTPEQVAVQKKYAEDHSFIH